MHRGRRTRWFSSTLVLVGLAAVLVAPLSDAVPAGPVAGRPATAIGSSQWAYSGSQIVNQSTSTSAYSVAQSGTYAWATELTETPSPGTVYSLEIRRGMTADYAYRLCTPACSAPTFSLSTSVAGTQWSYLIMSNGARWQRASTWLT